MNLGPLRKVLIIGVVLEIICIIMLNLASRGIFLNDWKLSNKRSTFFSVLLNHELFSDRKLEVFLFFLPTTLWMIQPTGDVPNQSIRFFAHV